MELTKALDSPDPLKFESCFPVHQDGTCNGLPHYAALGGDSRGAAQVNLAAGDRPSDVYTYVGKMAEKTIDADVEKGEKYAMLLQGKITRLHSISSHKLYPSITFSSFYIPDAPRSSPLTSLLTPLIGLLSLTTYPIPSSCYRIFYSHYHHAHLHACTH
ncbi:DNA/RNA polymerase [Dendrothele bispora CBS 962.96]|uniref:DNA-directed RNA polymerase n=1 Tax=Dendrothele bispora (strain CBS 962.96) TaxID=1314807 RepID=A0A4S8KMB6_DENBC|nr:DNA/RNA polymerase [Dendrothele bispora CBS 962.96]